MDSRQPTILTSQNPQSQEINEENSNGDEQSLSFAAATLMSLSNSSNSTKGQENRNSMWSQQGDTSATRSDHPQQNNTSTRTTSSRRPTDDNNNNSYSPQRRLAIIIENAQQINQDKCLRAVADVIQGKNIQYCTRLSGGRICLYLNDETQVEKMCERGGIVVDSEFLPIRRYISEATKFIISNCPPEMPDEVLKDVLEPYGKVVSPPARLRVSTAHEDLRHIKTWRRSVFILIPSNDPKQMPPRIIVTTPEGTKHTLYIEKDEVFCNFCNVPGHLTNRCKKQEEQLDKNFPAFKPPVSHRLLITKPSRIIKEKNSSYSSVTPDLMPNFNTTNKEQITEEVICTVPTEINKETENQPDKSQVTFSNNFASPTHTPTPTNLDLNLLEPQEPAAKSKLLISTPEVPQLNSQNQSILSTSLWGNDLHEEVFFPEGEKQQTKTQPTAKENTHQKTPQSNDDSLLINLDESESENMETENLTSNELLNLMLHQKEKPKKRFLSPDSPIQDSKILRTNTHEDSNTNDEEFSSLSESESVKSNDSKTSKRTKKKEEAAMDTVLNKMTFNDPELTKEKFIAFMSECRGKANSQKVVTNHTINVAELIKKLNQAQNVCKNFNLQRRFKRASDALTPNDGE